MKPVHDAARFGRRLRHGGIRWLVGAIVDRIAPARPKLAPQVLAAIEGKNGLEIGGPSRVFGARGMLPVYPRARRIDNVNFAGHTPWENSVDDRGSFVVAGRKLGTQWVREAVALVDVPSATYDFVLSSHCLEHVANPLAALREWHRVLRGGGHLVLVLPDPARTFDHRRPGTTLEHLRQDFTRGTTDDDRSHFEEVLALHDLARDPGAGSAAEFRARVEQNATHRCVHHHVFDLDLVSAALGETGWTVLASETARPCHLVTLARKEPA